MYSQIIKSIQESSKIAILSHVMPDGDNIGSSLALYNALQQLGKQAVYILDDDIPQLYRFLKGSEHVKKPGISNDFDLAIVLDCGDIDRLGKAGQYAENTSVIVIDHHISSKGFGFINHIVPEACATGELIYNLLKTMDFKLSKEIAECLYTAIVTDTGQFQYSNTTAATHEIVVELLNRGVIASEMFNKIYQSQPKSKLLLIKKTLESLEFYHNDEISCISLSQEQLKETGAMDSDTENIINFARDVDCVEVAVFIKEIDAGKVKVSLRSKKKANVSKIAVAFGGGGHIRASGCTIYEGMEKAKSMILEAVAAELDGGR